MPATSTADSKDSGTPVEPHAEPGITAPSSTHSAVKGELSPRLPFERDESAQTASAPNPMIVQASKDLEAGMEQTDRGEATDKLYKETLRGDAGAAVEHEDE